MAKIFSVIKNVLLKLRRMGLRGRIMWAMGAVSAVILAGSAAAIISGIPFIEHRLMAETLYYELRGAMHSAQGSRVTAVNPDHRFYTDDAFFRAEIFKDIPKRYLNLKKGFSEVEEGDRAYFVYKVVDGRTYIIECDQTAFEETEREIVRFVAGMAVLLLLLTLAVAWWLSGAVLSPVRALASSVRRSAGAGRYLPVKRIETDDEIGYLSLVCDRGIRHIYDLLQRERFFSSDLSHELRTHLSVISTAAEVIEAKAKDEGDAEAARRILRACASELRLLRVLLALARGDTTVSADDEMITVSEAAARVCNEQAAAAASRGLDLKAVAEGAPCEEKQSACLLETVMSNLTRNAVSHTRKGGVTLALLPDGFEVRDSGEGIAAEELNRIFEPFVQGSNGRPEGFGVGLSLVKRICERRNWELKAQSTQGKGSVFAVKFKAQPKA